MTDLTERNRKIWSAGDWDALADYVDAVGPRILDAAGVQAGSRALDVGTGSGGAVAIPAALRGAQVTALDVTDAWFDAARRRAAAAGVTVEWVQGDAMDMPLPDDAFDRVLSSFGHMFAPDHRRATAELVRVCAPGGVIAFATWRETGFPGQMFATIAGHMPPPPEGVQPPPLWGRPEHVDELFAAHGLTPEHEQGTVHFPFASADDAHAVYVNSFGPLVTARGVLGDRFGPLADALREVMEGTLEEGGLRADYLLTVVRT